MAEKENYVIRVEGKLVEVSPEVYYTYFHMERQERGQEEKKQRNAVVSYDALDSGLLYLLSHGTAGTRTGRKETAKCCSILRCIG